MKPFGNQRTTAIRTGRQINPKMIIATMGLKMIASSVAVMPHILAGGA